MHLLRGKLSSPVNCLGGRCPHMPFFIGGGGGCPALLTNSLDSDQARNFDKVSNFLNYYVCIHELRPGPRHEIYISKETPRNITQHAELIYKHVDINTGFATR